MAGSAVAEDAMEAIPAKEACAEYGFAYIL